MEKTLANLRKKCRESGITLKKETLSHGIHLSFIVDGIRVSESSVLPYSFYTKNKEAIEALKEIKKEFQDLTIDNEKVYGLK